MSVVFPINENDRFERYTLTGGQTLVSVPFPFQDNADIKLVRISVGGSSTPLSEPADYTLSGAGTPSSGAATLAVAGAAGEQIEVYGLAVLDRTSSIVRAGKFSSSAIDFDLDRNRIIQQEQARDIGRAIKAPLGSVGGAMLADEPGAPVTVDVDGNLVSGEIMTGLVATTFMAGLNASADDASETLDLLGIVFFDSYAAMKTNATRTYANTAVGSYFQTRDGYIVKVAASAAVDHHDVTTGGLKFYRVSTALKMVSGGGEPGYRLGSLYGTMDDLASGSIMFDGRSSFPNKLGVNNTKPVTEPAWGARANETTYVAGSAYVAAILSGYGNVNDALAGLIASQHSMLYAGADHASIIGGSLHTIYDDTDYSIIAGGTSCRIQQRGRYAGIYNSDQCLIETGATDAESGFRSSIIGSALCTIGGRNGFIAASVSSVIQSIYGSIFAGETITLTNGAHMGAGGSNIIMGGGAAATYSFAWGDDHQVDGSRSLIFGEGHRVAAGVDYNVTTGYRCRPPFIGARVHSARQRGGTVGNNQALDWTASQETTDTTITRLPAAGSSTYPTQPENSIVNGTLWVTAVSDAGVCSSFKIDLTSERIGSGTATLRANVTTTIYNGLALGTVPTFNVTTGGIYRPQVVGLAVTNIRWDARFTGQQVVFA